MPEESWQQKLHVGRQLMNRSVYFRKAHPSNRTVEALDKMLPPRLQKRLQRRVVRFALARPLALRIWRGIEAASPASRTIVSVLEEIKPDVVVISPTVWVKEPVEVDYVRAARSLGIPTVGYVASWDNLTSKGTIHLVPDVLALWNESLAKEARQIHSISRKAIRLTGAPYLDLLFQLHQTLSQRDMCERMGCLTDRPYIVYLCSSPTLIASEVGAVTALAETLAQQLGPEAPTIVVRPHPVNPTPWEDYAHSGVVVYPRSGDLAAGSPAWQDYYNQLSGSECVVGLNTTAFLEAVVADRPCLTIVADEFVGVQGQTGHFRHLLDGGFLEICHTVTDVSTRVGRILAGADENRLNRRLFLNSFLRPAGPSTPAATSFVAILESLVSP